MALVENSQNVFDFTLQFFGTMENLFEDVLIPNGLNLDSVLSVGQTINLNTVGKGNETLKNQIQEQGLVFTNNEIPANETKVIQTINGEVLTTLGNQGIQLIN